jgi:hypothetical protein
MNECPSCKAGVDVVVKVPLKIGVFESDEHVRYKCGSVGMIHTNNDVKYIRSIECASRRIVSLERELFLLKTNFWTDVPSEPKLLEVIRNTITQFENNQVQIKTEE